jgi:hypothetical protein
VLVHMRLVCLPCRCVRAWAHRHQLHPLQAAAEPGRPGWRAAGAAAHGTMQRLLPPHALGEPDDMHCLKARACMALIV